MLPTTEWTPEGEITQTGVSFIVDPTGNFLVDPSGNFIVDTGTEFSILPTTVWTEDDSI